MKEMKEMKKIRGFPDQNESLKFPIGVCGTWVAKNLLAMSNIRLFRIRVFTV